MTTSLDCPFILSSGSFQYLIRREGYAPGLKRHFYDITGVAAGLRAESYANTLATMAVGHTFAATEGSGPWLFHIKILCPICDPACRKTYLYSTELINR